MGAMSEPRDKEERKLKKVKIALMRNPIFALYQGVMMVGKTSLRDDIPTACTNGRDEIYGRAFIKELDEKELAFVVMHECMHKVYRHLTTWKKLHEENALLTNAACDYVINLKLKDIDPDGKYMRMPMKNGKPFGLIDEKYRGMNTKQVFDAIKQEHGEGGGEGEGFDEHDWDGAKEMTDQEKEELHREIDRAIRQGQIAAKKAGLGAGGLDRELGDLMEPKVDWREVLREFVKSICNAKDTSSWRRVNRRFIGSDIYLPTLVGERVGHIVIGIDTSGSIGVKELSDFLSEVKGIADEVRPEKVDLLYWDSEVAGHEEYDEYSVANIVSSTKPRGGGGTSPSCVTAYLKDKGIKPECVIMLTDGHVGDDWGGEWPCPVLWTIVAGNTDVAPNGKTIHIN
jgi:predicted metal-dependent peptidase